MKIILFSNRLFKKVFYKNRKNSGKLFKERGKESEPLFTGVPVDFKKQFLSSGFLNNQEKGAIRYGW